MVFPGFTYIIEFFLFDVTNIFQLMEEALPKQFTMNIVYNDLEQYTKHIKISRMLSCAIMLRHKSDCLCPFFVLQLWNFSRDGIFLEIVFKIVRYYQRIYPKMPIREKSKKVLDF